MPSPIEPLEPRRHLSAGDLDSSFGSGGTVSLRNGTVPTGGTPDAKPLHLAVDHAGRTLVVSSAYTAPDLEAAARPISYALTRLTPDGRPDARFALPTGGSIALNADDPPRKILVDSRDRIYVMSDGSVRRYTASGKIDRTYGRRGTAAPYNVFSRNVDATVTADDVLWLLGTNYDTEGPDGPYSYVTRIAPDGVNSRDVQATFAANEPVASIEHFETTTASGLLRTLPDGAVLAAFDTSFYLYLDDDNGASLVESGVRAFKFKPDGRPDRTYGKNGRVAYVRTYALTPPDENHPENDPITALTGLSDDGTVLILDHPAGGPRPTVTLTPAGRQGANASSDADPFPFGDYTDFVIHPQPGGRRLVYNGSDQTVRRYNANGTRDNTFNGGTPFTNVAAIAFGPDNTLLMTDTGRSTTDARFVVRRIEL